MPPRLCVIGSANIDLTFRAATLPRPGETVPGASFLQGFGGKGANQAVGAARLGAEVAFVGRVGSDPFGEAMLRQLRQEGIDVTHLRPDPGKPTCVAAILVEDSAQNCIVVVPGANDSLSAADVREAEPVIRSASAVLAQLETPVAATIEAFRIARAAGVRTLLNPAPAAGLPDELLALTDLCVPNEPELGYLTGQYSESLKDVEAAARSLLRHGLRAVIATLAERGALIVVPEGSEHVPAPRVVAADTSGAGDAFIGGLAVLLGEGLPPAEAVRRANAVAALSVTRAGTQASFPTRAEVESFLLR